ncbi:cell surface protein [uncultured Brachyspira sp.]|uniref:cell surface protein n=1 Tax=uncultured Brachyspira sp. TaxID=221953 RepID=UPI002613A088|nr:cell surface protein [uncultured Brachyspira sp.]
MKKYIALLFLMLSVSTSYVFGYYNYDDFIDFLVHSNQFRARLDKLGFKLEANNVHVAAGLTSITAGKIFNNLYSMTDMETSQNNGTELQKYFFIPKAVAGIGYKTSMVGVGLGYEFAYSDPSYQVHTPILTATVLNDNIRINVPVSIGIGSKEKDGEMGISTPIELRYYMNLPFMSNIRLYAKYGEYKNNANAKRKSFGIATRIYFRVETEDVLIEPIIRLQYDQALKTKDENGKTWAGENFDITAFNRAAFSTGRDYRGYVADDLGLLQTLGYKIEDPYRFSVAVPVGFTSSSDTISLYLEPSLSFNMIGGSRIYKSNQNNSDLIKLRKDLFYTVGYLVYGEIYLKPTKSLEWYTEIQTGGATVIGSFNKGSVSEFVLNASTGITWYFSL